MSEVNRLFELVNNCSFVHSKADPCKNGSISCTLNKCSNFLWPLQAEYASAVKT
jgi:hypothetical protein